MKQLTKIAILALIAAGILVPTALLLNTAPRPLSACGPININGNAALAAASDRGNGTSADPYVIEYRNITGPGALGVNAIRIQNTDAHVIVQHVLVHDWYNASNTVYVYNVRNLVFQHNNLTNGRENALFVSTSTGVTIRSNTIAGFVYAVYMYQLLNYNVTVTNNAFGVGYTSPLSNRVCTIDSGFITRGNVVNGNWWADYTLRYPSATSDGTTWATPYQSPGVYDYAPLVNNPTSWAW